jgi:iron complex outermembrane recepter protein
MITSQRSLGVLGAAAATLLGAAPVLAQNSTEALDEIVVTAQKRVERLQDVPLSITVADQAELERQQVNRIADLARVAPSLEMQQAPGQSVGGGGQIRGIGTQSFQLGAVGSVGIVVDQVSQGNTNISDLFDVARVEVLKGPQGTLFGLTTSAGVINIVTNAPQFDGFSARLRTELATDGSLGSEYGQQIVQGLVNIPLGDSSALRLSGNANLRQGVDRNTVDGDLDSHRTYNGRGRFLWKGDKLTVNLIGEYSTLDDDGQDFFVIAIANPALTAEIAQCGITAGLGNRDYCSTKPMDSQSKTTAVSAQIDYDASAFTLTSITALRKQDSGPSFLDIFRLDVNPLKIATGPANGDSDLLTQELRFASPAGRKVEYTAGVFFSQQNTHNEPSPFNITLTLPFPPFPTIPVVSLNGNDVHVDDDSSAAFGQATVHVGDHLSVIGGARYTSERLSARFRSLDGVMGTGSTGTDESNTSWKIGAQYEFNRDRMMYATISRGYKGPQIVLGDPSTPGNQPTVIRPEIPTSYEIGWKASFRGGALLTDLNVFSLDIEDYQGQLCTPNATGGLRCVPQNIDKVRSKGVEFNVFGRPTPNLSLNAGVIYDSVEYPAGFVGQDGSALGGEQLASAPEWKATASAEFSHTFSGSLEGFLGADAVYKSELRLAASTDPNVIYPDHWVLGGRVGLRGMNDRWNAALFVRNAGNDHEPIIRFQNFPDGSIGSYGQILTPQAFRQVGVSGEVRF